AGRAILRNHPFRGQPERIALSQRPQQRLHLARDFFALARFIGFVALWEQKAPPQALHQRLAVIPGEDVADEQITTGGLGGAWTQKPRELRHLLGPVVEGIYKLAAQDRRERQITFRLSKFKEVLARAIFQQASDRVSAQRTEDGCQRDVIEQP